jgi:hypothetical protein
LTMSGELTGIHPSALITREIAKASLSIALALGSLCFLAAVSPGRVVARFTRVGGTARGRRRAA